MQSNSFKNCVHCYNVQILKIFNLELQLINTRPMIKNKLKECLSELKMFKSQAIRNDCKTFHFTY